MAHGSMLFFCNLCLSRFTRRPFAAFARWSFPCGGFLCSSGWVGAAGSPRFGDWLSFVGVLRRLALLFSCAFRPFFGLMLESRSMFGCMFFCCWVSFCVSPSASCAVAFCCLSASSLRPLARRPCCLFALPAPSLPAPAVVRSLVVAVWLLVLVVALPLPPRHDPFYELLLPARAFVGASLFLWPASLPAAGL